MIKKDYDIYRIKIPQLFTEKCALSLDRLFKHSYIHSITILVGYIPF